ncbi:kinase-like protein [Suillus decipiens]|nr:kinase-like protein [Suillus decipiens]
MAICGARHDFSLPQSAQHRRRVHSVPGKELKPQNLRRFTDPLTHQTSLTAQNIASFNHPIPLIPVPDLSSFIPRPYPYFEPVARGAYGDIYKCVYHDPDGDVKVAVKVTRPLNSDKDLWRELGIWKRLRHPNILKLMGITRHFGRSVALVSPWMVNGNLTSFLSKNNETLGLRDRLLLLRDIAAGLNYLHTFNFGADGHTCFNPIVHGDLTGNNVLIGNDRTAFLADFGLSGTLTQLPGMMRYLAMSRYHPGALRWLAPELYSAEDSACVVTTQSDIYSFGSIMLQVLTGNLPWPHLTHDFQICQAINRQTEHPRPTDAHVTDKCWNFIASCWSKAPIDRPSAKEVLQFIDDELVLYDRGNVNDGQHPALVPVSGYTPQVIGPIHQSPSPTPSPAPHSMLPPQIYSQLLHPVLLFHLLLYLLKYIRNQRCGTKLERWWWWWWWW